MKKSNMKWVLFLVMCFLLFGCKKEETAKNELSSIIHYIQFKEYFTAYPLEPLHGNIKSIKLKTIRDYGVEAWKDGFILPCSSYSFSSIKNLHAGYEFKDGKLQSFSHGGPSGYGTYNWAFKFVYNAKKLSRIIENDWEDEPDTIEVTLDKKGRISATQNGYLRSRYTYNSNNAFTEVQSVSHDSTSTYYCKWEYDDKSRVTRFIRGHDEIVECDVACIYNDKGFLSEEKYAPASWGTYKQIFYSYTYDSLDNWITRTAISQTINDGKIYESDTLISEREIMYHQ